MVGHHEGDPPVGVYRTQEEMDQWAERCPIKRFRALLLDSGQATTDQLDSIDSQAAREVEDAVAFARSSPAPERATATDGVWAQPINPPLPESQSEGHGRPTVVQGWLDAVRDGIAEEMRRDPHVVYFGEGTGQRGGTFAHTKGLYEEFGPERMIDTPICEAGFTGASIGTSATGCRTVADLMISDFLFEAGSQIVLQAARLRYMSNGQLSVPMVIRSGMGTVKNAGPHHSGCYHPVWSHCPGLIVVIPSNPADAKGLFKTALRASDPVVFLEHKSLLSTKGPVPVGEHVVPFGEAKIVRAGTDLTVVSCGLWLHRCVEAAEQLAAGGISCEVIDLRTIVPLDTDAIVTSVAKTGRVLVVDEAYAMCGLGAEIAAVVMEHAFDELDAPVGRLHTEPVPHPFSPTLEDAVVADVEKIAAAARAVIDGRPLIPRRAPGRSPSVPKTPQADAPKEQTPEASPAGSRLAPPAAPTGPIIQGTPLLMPNVDLTITEGTIVSWLKKPGEAVHRGEAVVEVETDKAVMEVESPADGTLAEILAEHGAVVALGQQLGTITLN